MPPSANARPPSVAMSGLADDFFLGESVLSAIGLFYAGLSHEWASALAQYLTTKLNDFSHHFLSRLEDQKLLAACQRHDGIRRNFDMFYQVAVDDKRNMVQPSKLDQEVTPIMVQVFIGQQASNIYVPPLPHLHCQ